MEDVSIIGLYQQRDESAIAESERKYGSFCMSVAMNILSSREDAEECVNDTWLTAWNKIPPEVPVCLRAFLGSITRSHSLNRWKALHRDKRGGGELPLVLEELSECVSGAETVVDEVIAGEMAACVDRFLRTLPETERRLFLCRCWLGHPLPTLAERFGMKENYVRTVLSRTRKKLRRALEKEGYTV